MNDELRIKVQAFLDGELPEAEAREMAALLARDPEAAALHGELKNTRAALVDFERRIVVPEGREFYWSKIQREIERTEAAKARPEAEPVSIFKWLIRTLLPVTGLALLTVALFVMTRPAHLPTTPIALEVASVDSSTMTYRNYESGTTLVWLSYPAENELAGGDAAGRIN